MRLLALMQLDLDKVLEDLPQLVQEARCRNDLLLVSHEGRKENLLQLSDLTMPALRTMGRMLVEKICYGACNQGVGGVGLSLRRIGL